MHPFVVFLQQRLTQALPGQDAQRRMAPRFEDGSYRSFTTPPDARKSAVLALLSMHNSLLSLLLTLRSNNLPSHKGQFSFPGGRMELGETIEEAALRETHEEIGIEPSEIHLIGHLSELYTPPSNSSIFPVVGWCEHLPDLSHSPHEVEEVHIVPLQDLLHEHAIEEDWDYRGVPMRVPFWRLQHATPLWGATAIMISELMTLYREWLDASQL